MSERRILRRIRKEFDYEAYVEVHYQVKRTARSSEIRICCPNCGDSKYKLYVNNDKKLFNCYKCEFTSGNFDVFDFVAITEAIPRGKAMLRLAQEFAPTTPLTMAEVAARLAGNVIDVEEDEPGENSSIVTIDALPEKAVPLVGSEEAMATEEPFWRYLLGERGLTVKEVLGSKVHAVPSRVAPVYKYPDGEVPKYVGDIGHRVVFPVYGPGGRLVSWLSRPISADYTGAKYINCPGSEINRTTWPFVPPHVGSAVLVEGILDCISVRRLGPPFSAYATFGKKVGYDQIQHLKSWGVTDVTLFWDPDAKKAMVKAANELKMHFNVSVPDFSAWPEGADPGDMLTHPDGIVQLEKALCTPVDVDSLDYVAWQIEG